ncbi:MAG: methyl-accepting chemotaxis protein, partial [Microcystis panniformis]
IQKCLAELEKINAMRSDFSNLNNKMEELSEFSNLKDKIEKLKDEMEELFETIPNPPQKDVEKGIKTIFDNFTNKF